MAITTNQWLWSTDDLTMWIYWLISTYQLFNYSISTCYAIYAMLMLCYANDRVLRESFRWMPSEAIRALHVNATVVWHTKLSEHNLYTQGCIGLACSPYVQPVFIFNVYDCILNWTATGVSAEACVLPRRRVHRPDAGLLAEECQAEAELPGDPRPPAGERSVATSYLLSRSDLYYCRFPRGFVCK